MSSPTEPEGTSIVERIRYPVYVLLAIAMAAGVAVLLWRRPEPATIRIIPPEPTLIPTVTATPGPYMVYVTGAVQRPEAIVTVNHGSRVVDAIAAAGGALDSADLERINLAQVLEDGDQVQIPTRMPGSGSGHEAEPVRFVVTATPGSCTVYVVGEVTRPGALITLARGSRVQDAVDAAGGATANADLARVNLSQIVNDGDYVYVPPRDGEPILTPTPNRPPLVHINVATVEELATLPGIGPALAEAIVDYRENNGPFASVDELDAVPGIGPAKLDAIRDQIAID